MPELDPNPLAPLREPLARAWVAGFPIEAIHAAATPHLSRPLALKDFAAAMDAFGFDSPVRARVESLSKPPLGAEVVRSRWMKRPGSTELRLDLRFNEEPACDDGWPVVVELDPPLRLSTFHDEEVPQASLRLRGHLHRVVRDNFSRWTVSVLGSAIRDPLALREILSRPRSA